MEVPLHHMGRRMTGSQTIGKTLSGGQIASIKEPRILSKARATRAWVDCALA